MPGQSLFKLLDSWGKIPAGILSGHIRELGHFEQCLKTEYQFNDTALGSFKGQYCTGLIPMELIKKFLNVSLESTPVIMPTRMGFQLGICMPDTCTPDKINELWIKMLKFITKDDEINGTLVYSCEINKEINFTAADYIASVIFGLIGAFMLLSSIYDYFMRIHQSKPNDLLVAFSVITNGEKLFKISTHKSPNTIDCLNGMRCITIVWIVLGHSYVMFSSGNFINGVDALTWMKSFFAVFFIFGTVSVDTFLFLSGLLIVWSAFREMEKSKGRLNILMMYVHRYLRLTPALAAAVLFCVSFVKYIGSGPFWQQSVTAALVESCEHKWWTTLLFIQNYYNVDSEVCIPQTWYLGVDTQLYVLSPLVLIPLWKWGRKVILPIIILALLSNACVFTIFMKYNLSTIKSSDSDNGLGGELMKLTYMPTHARYAPWLIGVLAGYFLFENKNKKVKLAKALVILGWLLSIGTMLAIIVGPYNRKREGGGDPTKIESSFYEAFSRTSWAIALSWIVFACHHGYGAIVNDILSWTFWQPFSRLTYSIYIVHMIVQYVVAGNSKHDQHFSNFDVIYKFWGDFGFTICISILLVLGFESPIVGIEKVLFKKGNNSAIDKRQLVTVDKESDNKSNENMDDKLGNYKV